MYLVAVISMIGVVIAAVITAWSNVQSAKIRSGNGDERPGDRRPMERDEARRHYDLGDSLFGSGQYEEALKEFQTAIELDQDNASYHCYLGVTLHELGRVEEALAEVREAARIDPSDPIYQNNIKILEYRIVAGSGSPP